MKMRILIVGAGAIGGYIGGRLLQAGKDVTFLVRPQRAALLARDGLVVKSPLGDIHYPAPHCAHTGEVRQSYDLILLSCKSYDLEQAMEDFAPAVAPYTAILPLLNGMRHLDMLEKRFTRQNVLGGQCRISLDRDASGAIVHHNDVNQISFGELDEVASLRTRSITEALRGGAGFEAIPSSRIMQEMWEKWTLIATGAGMTCLMRAALGDILAAGGKHLTVTLLDECAEIASMAGYPLRPAIRQRYLEVLTEPGSTLMASVLRDVERSVETEAEHILGDLMERWDLPEGDDFSILAIALVHLRSYEARRLRET
ncbi:ketopantoate reductase family protein [Pseudomonas aeruginosa]|uniref:ketopantoate reductase family protein n=1 Tax=Pseudomonas aeruginosa TaxID=287 RepID=UPI001F257609|nr:ketopantoate reductase family protein [Pseudomonas aeruginosa]